MLGAIRRVTISTTNLEETESAYTEFLEYRVAARGEVTSAEAAAWNAPKTEGVATLSMQPAGGNDFEFRFIEGPAYPDYVPLTTYGWNAFESIVTRDSTTGALGTPKVAL